MKIVNIVKCLIFLTLLLSLANSQGGGGGGGGSSIIDLIIPPYYPPPPQCQSNCSTSTAGVIVGISLGVCVICSAAIKVCVSNFMKKFPCHTFYKLKKMYNIVDTGAMPIE
jgi:hypothetical protein